MSSVCPFAKAASSDGGCLMKSDGSCDRNENGSEDKVNNQSHDSSVEPPKCPFGYDSKAAATFSDGGCPMKSNGNHDRLQTRSKDTVNEQSSDSSIVPPKCPFGFDSHTFKLGPLSCMLCKALLYECSKCMPCSHKFCKACISRFKDCPLCGADIEKIEPDMDLQVLVDRFINGHARIKRTQVKADEGEARDEQQNVIYGDVSMERGAFLVQQAMMAFRAQNIESAKYRLSLCAEDIREQLKTAGDTSELCSQLGAVLGMLGDCCRSMGNNGSAVTYYEESAEFLSKIPTRDLELVHTLSVSLNKIGDLSYYDGDLQSAKSYYSQALGVRRDAVKEHKDASSQIWVWPERLLTMHLLGYFDVFTTNTSLTRIRAVPRYSFTFATLEAPNTLYPTIGIMPTGLPWGRKPSRELNSSPGTSRVNCYKCHGSAKVTLKAEKVHQFVNSVPYSEHSCFSEIKEFVKLVRPSSITGIVSSSSWYINPYHYFCHLSSTIHISDKSCKKFRNEINGNSGSSEGCRRCTKSKAKIGRKLKDAILSVRRSRVRIQRREKKGAKLED